MSQPAFIPDFSEGLETGLYLALLELIDEGLIITGDEVILEANSAACRLLERDYREIAGKPLEILFPSGQAFLEARERLLIQGEMRGSLQVALPGGRKRVLRFIAAARLRPGIHAIIISPDILSETTPAMNDAPTDALWPRLAAALEQPVLVLDRQDRIRAVNTAAVHTLDTPRDTLIGDDVHSHLCIEWPTEDGPPVAQVQLRGEQAQTEVLRTRVLDGPKKGWRTLILPTPARSTPSPRAEAAPRIDEEQDASLGLLRAAIEREQLELHFQPLINARDNRVVGGEALLRWNHPGSGQLPFHRFAELARAGGLLPDMARWSLPRAIAEASQWPADTVLTINLSPEQALAPGLNEHLRTTLEAIGLPPDRLELDFDEAVLNHPGGESILHAAHALGVRIAIDDFGRGAFPLPALRRHPVHAIKLTPALVRGVGYDEDSEAVVEAICRMAEVLGLDVLARGVETQAQQAFLLALGCRLQQGPLFGPPLPGDTFSAFLPRTGGQA